LKLYKASLLIGDGNNPWKVNKGCRYASKALFGGIMKIAITGGLGFVCTQLCARFLERGHQVTVIDHSSMPKSSTSQEIRYVSADTTVPGAWQDEVRIQDAVINLAGTSIFQRWNEKTKLFIYNTRILTTRNVVEAMAGGKSSLLCST
jgi:NAD dependent epimerase/dehydratase family enzyme